MQRHFIIVVGLPQINGLDGFGLLFDIGSFCTWGGLSSLVYTCGTKPETTIHHTRINVALFMSLADRLLFRH